MSTSPLTPLTPCLDTQLDGSEIALIPVTTADLDDSSKIAVAERAWMDVQGFTAKKDSYCLMAGKDGGLSCAFIGVGDTVPEVADIWWLSAVAAALPTGRYAIAEDTVSDEAITAGALGWCLAHYDFDVYKSKSDERMRTLAISDGHSLITHISHAVSLVRDMVNTPCEDMGPAELAAIAEELASTHGADYACIEGEELVAGFPAIHAVGRAAATPPRLIEVNWTSPHAGEDCLSLAVVGKGVCFDTGGLNLKGGGSMAIMKKDMGGAAHAMALASLIMAENLPLKLQLLIPAVENSVAGNAFRPGDVLDTRQGLTVEIGNTDAEGRLVLCDALTYACENDPDMILDFATLTGAARVALGPDMPATYCNDDTLWDTLNTASNAVGDPLWRMPLWAGYTSMLDSKIADLNNVSDGGFAGSITAALYLEHFVKGGVSWLHLDTYAWRPNAKPGQPVGGEAQGLRATFEMLAALTTTEEVETE